MKVSINTLIGVEVACVDIEATLQVGDLLALLPDQVGGTECSRRLLFGDIELTGSMSLSDIGLEEGSMLTLVRGPMLRVLTASDDGTAKVWSTASGECLLTLEGHHHDGQQVLTASLDGTAKVWSAASGRVPAHLGGSRAILSGLQSSPPTASRC